MFTHRPLDFHSVDVIRLIFTVLYVHGVQLLGGTGFWDFLWEIGSHSNLICLQRCPLIHIHTLTLPSTALAALFLRSASTPIVAILPLYMFLLIGIFEREGIHRCLLVAFDVGILRRVSTEITNVVVILRLLDRWRS